MVRSVNGTKPWDDDRQLEVRDRRFGTAACVDVRVSNARWLGRRRDVDEAIDADAFRFQCGDDGSVPVEAFQRDALGR
nr:hypothetical protein [Halomicrobium mukohataei]